MNNGILASVRAQARQEGWSQAMQVKTDDYFERGWQEGYKAGKKNSSYWFVLFVFVLLINAFGLI